MNPIVVIVVVIVVVVVALVALANRRRHHDGVDSFRRQIDALSPEARRPVVDQVQNAAGRRDDRDEPESDDESDGESDDGDGARGT